RRTLTSSAPPHAHCPYTTLFRSEDYTAYMLTDMLKGTFEPYGSADYIQMDGLNIAGKTGTTSYSRSVREEYNLPDNAAKDAWMRSEEHTSELQSRFDLVCRLLLE